MTTSEPGVRHTTSEPYFFARIYAARRVRDGDLPAAAAQDAADTYGLSVYERDALVDELEAEPSAGRITHGYTEINRGSEVFALGDIPSEPQTGEV